MRWMAIIPIVLLFATLQTTRAVMDFEKETLTLTVEKESK